MSDTIKVVETIACILEGHVICFACGRCVQCSEGGDLRHDVWTNGVYRCNRVAMKLMGKTEGGIGRWWNRLNRG